jgi:multidrug efflux pump subunit AcrA (membrane-fusion protein)
MRPLVLLPLIVIGSAAAWFQLHPSGTAAAAATEQTVTVTSGTLRQTVSASGTLEPAATEDLDFSAAGKVTAVNVKAGQQVTKGTVLATIDSAALQSQVTQARATVDAAIARLDSDQTANASSAQITADSADLAAANALLASAQAALAGASLTSPIDGIVSSVDLTVGQQLSGTGTSGTSVSGTGTGSGRTSAASASSTSGSGGSATGATSTATTSSTSQIQIISVGSYVVNLAVDDTQIGQIKEGQQATVTPSTSSTASTGSGAPVGAPTAGAAAGQNTGQPAAAAPATGTVTSVGTIASSTSGVASFPVVVTVAGTPSGFFAGSAVQVGIVYNQLDNVIQVPSLAITRDNGQASVVVLANGKKTNTPVTTGLVAGGQTQITQGLTAGQQIVVTIPTVTNRPAGATGNTGGGFGGRFPGGGAPGGGVGGAQGGFRGGQG